uniref:Uncharacterized protein n=1 Tax=Labrus bergylta TaxID=56723 RepID=A0A3Q3MAI6_9LABR
MRLMRLPSHRQCAVEGDGKKMDQAPPFRNPFVHLLKFTPLEKAKLNLSTLLMTLLPPCSLIS